jgi:autotransporter-associated beta strand protein
MWKSRWNRGINLPTKRKKTPARLPSLEQLEVRCLFATNITQYHVDYQSTGANLTETQLTPSNVNPADFGQLYNAGVDGQVYAEPLVLTNVTIVAGPNTTGKPGTYNSVVFVATQHDSLYALNAANGAVLWQRTFLDTTNPNDALSGATSVTTVPSADTNTDDINPEVGITGTPVIDPSSNIIYVIPKTKEIVGGNAYYVQRLHAIKVGDGTDAVNSFVIGTTTGGNLNTNNTPILVNGTGDGNVGGVVQFNALREANRPALSLVNGQVYAEWASHGDNGPYHGWVVTWNVTNLATQGMVLSGVLCTDPNGALGGIWGGGGGLTFDPSETFNGQPAFYFEVGNGASRGGNPALDGNGFPIDHSYYESLVKAEADPTTNVNNQNSNGWGLKIADYFTPYNVNALDDADEDFGSGSPLVLPDAAGIPNHPHLIVAAGKEGKIYLLDRDNLGKFNNNDDNVLNAVLNSSTNVTTPPVLINGSLSTPAYYHGEIYWVPGYGSNAFSYVVAPNPAPNPPSVPVAAIEPTSETANTNFGYVPGSVMITANGGEDPNGGIVWIMDRGNGDIHAYSSLSLSTELWNSGPGSINTVKFAVPTIANGQVFVGTQNSLQAFGITGPSTPAQAPNTPANVAALALSGSAIELTWTDNTASPNFATNYAIQQSTDDIHFTTVANAGQESTSYTVTGLNQSTTYYYQIVGSNSAGSSGASNVANATTTNQTGQTPTAPQGLGATPASGSEAFLTWTNTANNETGFTLTRATDNLFTQNVVTQTLASAPFYYTDAAAGMSPGNTYYYRLQATNSAGSSSTSNTATVNIPKVPPAPTNASAVENAANQVVVSWTDHAGPFALGYQVSRSVDGGPYFTYLDLPETSDAPPSTQSFTDTNVPLGHIYSYQIVAENVSGFSAPATATIAVLGQATLTIDNSGNVAYTVSPGAPDRLSVQLASGKYTLADPAVIISVTGAGAGFVTGAGTSSVTVPAGHVSAITLDTTDNADSISIISDAVPITITADSGGGRPTVTLGDPVSNETISGSITNASNGFLTIAGSGATNITGALIFQAGGGVLLAGSGTIHIGGNINLGPAGNLFDVASGKDTISGIISGTASSGFATIQGLTGTYFHLGAAANLIQPAQSSNSSWLGNQLPAVVAQLVGPIDFPDIADNGFIDSVGDPAYYNLGVGNNNNVEARWFGNITIPGSGSTPVPINFATTSDDGSMLYIDGNVVVNNNFFQGPTQRTGLVNLTPGVHAIDVEFYQGSGGAVMNAQWDTSGGTNFVDIPNSAFSTTAPANGVTMAGAGTLTLSKTNTYSGSTTIDAGTLIVSANGAMGPATATGIVVNGGALAFAGGLNYTTAEPISINGMGPAGNGAIENISGSNTFASPITVPGAAVIGSVAGTLNLSGAITCQGAGITLTGSGAITIAGNINLGPAGNLTDSGAGQDKITGVISGTAPSGLVQGLAGTYFNLAASGNLIQPIGPGNPSWLGNQTPAATARLIGPIDFPDIANNGFVDNLGDPNYYNLGAGSNNNVEARWYGEVMIPGSGTTPVPINFATASDDGSMLYIDGTAVVNNNFFQGTTQRTGLANLTPGLHAIDVEFYQGGGGASMDVQWDTSGGTNFVDIPNSAFFVSANGVVQIGGGTLTLTKTNTYSGPTTVSSGTLIVAANGAMGPATAAGITINNGAALAFTGGLYYGIKEPITISGSGPAGKGAIENISGANALAIPFTLAGSATVGSDAGTLTLDGTITTGTNTLTVIGAGSTIINSKIVCQAGGVTLADSGTVTIAGNINLGLQGNLIDLSSGQDTISGVISGTATSGLIQGLAGTFFNLPAAQNLIQPAVPSNTTWLGNQTPAAAARLIGPLDFPDISDNGFADNVGDPAYYTLGPGVNDNVESRWVGPIMIPGNGLAPVPINFATTSDDGSMLYIDGNAVVNNNAFQGPTQATGIAKLTPGVHFIDIEYYQGGGGASLVVQWDPTGGTNFVDIPLSAFVVPVNGVLKSGTGTLTLSNTDPYLGPTTVNAGLLLVNGTLSRSAVAVNSGATLGGNGSVLAATVQSGGFLAPGDSPGTLTIKTLALTAGSTFSEQLGGTSAGTGYDQTIIPTGGTVGLNGATLSISFVGGFVPAVGQQFTIVSNLGGSSVTGTFSQGSTYTTPDGFIFGINYAGGAGHDVVLTVLCHTITTLSASPSDSSVFGQPITFTATVSPNPSSANTPSGTVTFLDGTVFLGTATLNGVAGNDQASFSVSSLSAGTHHITAVYGGDLAFAASVSADLPETVFAVPQIQNGVLAVAGTDTAATITLTPVLPSGATAYSIRVSYTSNGVTKNYGPYAVTAIVVYGGPSTDAFVLNGTGASDSFTVGNGQISEFAAQTTLFTVTLNAVTSTTLSGKGGADGLTGPNQTDTFLINGMNTGTLNASINFLNIVNLTGGSVSNTFSFASGASVNHVYGAGTANTLDYSAYGSPVTINLQTRTANAIVGTWTGIQSFVGTGTTDTLIGANVANAWSITGANAGSVGTYSFKGFPNLDGGTGNDTFTFAAGVSMTGVINGEGGANMLNYSGFGSPVTVNLQTSSTTGIGGWANIQTIKGTNKTDTLIGQDGTTNTWALNGINAGTVDGVTFTGFANLTGGSGADVFQFAAATKVTGVVNGAGGSNTLDYTAYTSNVMVNLGSATTGLNNSSATAVDGGAANGIANIGTVIVGAGNNYLTAVGVSTNVTFTVNGNGNNILVGGSGSNTLTVLGSGNNVIIADQGTSVLNGGTGYNLLIGGTTNYDGVVAGLNSIRSIWSTVNSASAYATAIKKLTAPAYAYVLSSATVKGNNADTLNAGTHALDWYFAVLASEITGKNPGETITSC